MNRRVSPRIIGCKERARSHRCERVRLILPTQKKISNVAILIEAKEEKKKGGNSRIDPMILIVIMHRFCVK